MKCQCGYDNGGAAYDHNAFIRVSGHYTITREGDGYYQPPIDEVDVWACPKCGTLRIQHWSICEEKT